LAGARKTAELFTKFIDNYQKEDGMLPPDILDVCIDISRDLQEMVKDSFFRQKCNVFIQDMKKRAEKQRS
jgi:hypothetical protein